MRSWGSLLAVAKRLTKGRGVGVDILHAAARARAWQRGGVAIRRRKRGPIHLFLGLGWTEARSFEWRRFGPETGAAPGSPVAISPQIVPRVLVTREEPEPVSQAVRLAAGEPVELPLLATRWIEFDCPEGRKLEDYDWIAFTSPRALEAIASKASAAGWSWPPQVAAAAVGDRTAHEMQACGWMPECVSEEASAHGLVQALQTRSVKGARILFPCSAIAEPTFPEGMRAAGALVDLVHVYTTEPVWLQQPLEKPRLARQLAEELRRGCIATCASPSAARALAELAQEAAAFRELQRTPIVVIGTTTARAVSDLGLHPVDAGGRSLGFMARKAVEIGRQMV